MTSQLMAPAMATSEPGLGSGGPQLLPTCRVPSLPCKFPFPVVKKHCTFNPKIGICGLMRGFFLSFFSFY